MKMEDDECVDECVKTAADVADGRLLYEPYKPYSTIDGRITTADYGINLYRIPYHSANRLGINGTGTEAIVRRPLSRRYSNGVQPYSQEECFPQHHRSRSWNMM